jgi:type IV secretion system protein VirD4
MIMEIKTGFQRVLPPTIDPGYEGRTIRYNLLSEIRLGGFTEVRDTRAVAQHFVDPQNNKKNDHWDKEVVSLLIAAILHIRYCRRDKTVAGLIQFLSEANHCVYKMLRSMVVAKHDAKNILNWMDPLTLKRTRTHPMIASIAREFLKRKEDDLTIIVNVALIYLKSYSEDKPCNVVIRDLKFG